jgi:acyl-CoA thioester hydrolase
MPRNKIHLPGTFSFTCTIPVRITDINYGGHAGNDTILSLIHEARMQYLGSLGYSEMDFAGVGMIMADVSIEFKRELFYGDLIVASVAPGEISKIGFDLFYKLETGKDQGKVTAVVARTHMICYDYEKKRIAAVPEEFRNRMEARNSGWATNGSGDPLSNERN